MSASASSTNRPKMSAEDYVIRANSIISILGTLLFHLGEKSDRDLPLTGKDASNLSLVLGMAEDALNKAFEIGV